MTSVRNEAGGPHRDGSQESERRPAGSTAGGLGCGEKQEGQESRATTRVTEEPHSGAEGALSLKPRTGRPTLEAEEGIQTWSPSPSPERPETSQTALRSEEGSDRLGKYLKSLHVGTNVQHQARGLLVVASTKEQEGQGELGPGAVPRETILSWFCQLRRAEPWARVSPDATLGMTDGGQHNRAQRWVTVPGQVGRWASGSQCQWPPAASLMGTLGADGSSHQQRKTSGLCSGKGQKVHRACGEPLTANN